jgi:curli biogenesis system outer membrane secretion channel CsgG
MLALSTSNTAAESAVKADIEELADRAISKLADSGGLNQAVAVADFDNKSAKAIEANLGHAASEVITERFIKSGKFVVIEKRQITKIVSQLELEQTGLYDSKKTAAVGNLIGAKFMVVGSVSEIGGFFNTSLRIVKIETGEIILSESKEISAITMNSVADLYKPADYRFILGAGLMGQKAAGQMFHAALDLHLAINYAFTQKHNALFSVSGSIIDTGASPGIGITYTATSGVQTPYKTSLIRSHFFNILAGYSYSIHITPILSIKPYLAAGIGFGSYRANLLSNIKQEINFTSPVAEIGTYITILERNPLSLWISPGFNYAFNKFEYSTAVQADTAGAAKFTASDQSSSLFGFFVRGGFMIYI